MVDICRTRQVTGSLELSSWGRRGALHFRAGDIVAAAFGALDGEQAIAEMMSLRDGMFGLSQYLPSLELTGSKRDEIVTDLRHAPLDWLVNQCREHALSCSITIRHAGATHTLVCRAGVLVEHPDDAVVAALFQADRAAVEIRALPLDVDVEATKPEAAAYTPAPARRTPRRKRRSSPPPIPAARPAAEPAVRTSTAAAQPTPPSPPPVVNRPPSVPPQGWVDPTWVARTREFPAVSYPPPARLSFGNKALGLGILGVTLLVGVVAAGL